MADLLRFTPAFPCPVCGGHERLPRGQGRRCDGFLSGDGLYAHCGRDELAGALSPDRTGHLYAHRLVGPCRCGLTHGEPVVRDGLAVVRYQAPRGRSRAAVGDAGVPVWEDPAWRLAATYTYRDANGLAVYRVRRWERRDGTAKTFTQQRPDGSRPSGWAGGLHGLQRVPYRLPELLASAVRRPVVIVEGEKAVEVARSLGFVATCNPEGAHKGSWRPELSPWLAGRHVVVLPDNDADGVRHADEVATALSGVAARVRWLELPGLAAKGDICDWAAGGGTREELSRLITAAPLYADYLQGARGDRAIAPDPRAYAPVLTGRHEVVPAWT